MAVTLLEAQPLMTDNLQAGVVESIYTHNPLLGLLPFEDNKGHLTYSYNLMGDAEGSTSRQVNADFTEGTAAPETRAFTLGILGGKAYVDNFIQQTVAPVDMLAAQINAKSKQVGLRFQWEFFNGDVAGNLPAGELPAFDGLKKLALGEDLTAGTLDLDDLDLVIDGVQNGATAIFANQTTASNLIRQARNKVQLTDVDAVGVRLQSYNGVPIIKTGVYKGNQVLADGEIYAVRLGTDGVFGIQASLPNPGIYAPNSEKPGWTVRYDWYVGLAARKGSVFRIKRTLA